jgi:hypothetical protein
MKYMTADLVARTRSEDDAIVESAAIEWERQGERYREYLQQIESVLIEPAKKLLQNYELHDAKILTITADDGAHFSVFVELEAPGNANDRYLEIRYQLAGTKAKLETHKELSGDGKPLGWWLYDELELVHKTPFLGTHSILLSGGYEFQIRFSSLECIPLNFVLWRGDADFEKEVERLAELCA